MLVLWILQRGSQVDAAMQHSMATLASLRSVKADVQVAEADVAIDQTNLEKACICSPANGIVLQRNVAVGQVVLAPSISKVYCRGAAEVRALDNVELPLIYQGMAVSQRKRLA